MSASPHTEPAATTAGSLAAPSVRDYVWVTVGLAAVAVLLFVLVSKGAADPAESGRLIGPMLAMAALVGLVLLATAITRNYAILSGITSGRYYYAQRQDHPPDWVERPARTFRNLTELPPLFYLVCVLMLVIDRLDAAQLHLAWAFVGLRTVHALVYSIWNHLPTRFGAYMASFVTLIVLYVRFAGQTTDLWLG